ncbi:MAG: hypothetical protein LBD79_11110 [Treponema sp.]|jgi:hypothetical protein|nr:hypothetical protein [Treponema sp.]
MKILKKFLWVLLILVVLGGAAFFFGWAQLTVPTDAYGVMMSKTHGLDHALIRAGEFRWVWYKLIPNNVEIQVFRLKNMLRPLRTNGTLPSSAEYAALAGSPVDFSYQIEATLSFSIKSESLINLVISRHIKGQDGLDAFEETLADEIQAFALQRLRVYLDDELKMEELLASGSIAQLNYDIQKAFPDIENLSLVIHTPRFPDLKLYQDFRSLYQEYIARQKDCLHTEVGVQAETRISSYIRFDELSRLGELLTTYPILLEYLQLEATLK